MQQQVAFSTNGASAHHDDMPNDGLRAVVMILIGEYDISSRDRLKVGFERLRDAEDVILDLTEVSYLDSTAITAFMRLHATRSAKGLTTETIVMPNENLRKIFNILNLNTVFHLTDRLEDAVALTNRIFELDFVADK